MIRSLGLCSLLALVSPVRALEPVSFNRDIRPIMSDTCFHCHGFDAKTREAGLRLDRREDAIRETEEGALPIVPGDPDKSEIIVRIFDEDDPMPPEKAHKPLTPEQKELFRRWVAEGAVYEPHWSYAPLVRPELPRGENGANPVDRFIRARLPQGLGPSPEAPREVLFRRLSLDLTGLPPDAHDFLTPDLSIEAATDALLASPHFGERIAVWWLDVARYADTVGFHGDQNQRIFPYRDYVIDAFNRNKPFDVFTREQLAGDLLPGATTEQLVATGYNRLNMMTREGGAQPKEYLAKYGAERVRSVAAAWFGSTFGCAECHDHKFDPIKTRDFYELQSFFADVKQWGVYSDYGYTPEPELKGFNNEYPFPPEIEVESPWLKRRHEAAAKELHDYLTTTINKSLAAPAAVGAREAWENEARAFLTKHPTGWLPAAPKSAQMLKDGKAMKDRKVSISGKGSVAADRLARGESMSVVIAPGDLETVAALKLAVADDELDAGSFAERLGKSVTISLEVRNAEGKSRKVAMGPGEAGAKRPTYRSGAEVPGLTNEWKLPIERPEAGAMEAVWLLAQPLGLAAGEELVLNLGSDNLLPIRISLSPFGAVDPTSVGDVRTVEALAKDAAARGDEEKRLVAEAFLVSTAFEKAAVAKARELAEAKRSFFGGRAWTMVTRATAVPLTVRVLPRGNWQDESGDLVLPATPSFLPGRIESNDGKRLTRLDLANWIASDANPITARAVVNRLWAMFFGTGLSAAVDDLGSQGELPSHPELLDWLAADFRDSGWDVKRLIRLIVTSGTYRQSSDRQQASLATDPANRLLSSQNPRRLEAEFVRDNALAIAGLLKIDEIGGPSVKPYQPADYYAALQFPNREYLADTDDRQWRRGLYTHWQRTFLHPMLANFDAPARDECAATRVVSNTPQQALTLLNDPAFVEAARVFAARLLEAKPEDDASGITRAYLLALNRAPQKRELEALGNFLTEQRKAYQASPEDAAKLVTIGLSPKATLDPVEHAAWTQVARVLLNTQEVITRY